MLAWSMGSSLHYDMMWRDPWDHRLLMFAWPRVGHCIVIWCGVINGIISFWCLHDPGLVIALWCDMAWSMGSSPFDVCMTQGWSLHYDMMWHDPTDHRFLMLHDPRGHCVMILCGVIQQIIAFRQDITIRSLFHDSQELIHGIHFHTLRSCVASRVITRRSKG